jgi:hypothetical protein
MRQIQASVGLGGHNRPADVGIIQQMLTDAGEHPGPVDRRCGRLTISAIERFQHRVLRRPDGRVDINGPTWRRLSATTPKPKASAPAAQRAPAPARRSAAAPAKPSAAPSPATARPATSAATPSADRRTFWKTETALPARGSVNRGLSSPGPESQIKRFGGRPSEIAYRNGGPVTNPKLRGLIVTEDVGPFRVTGIRPAVASLRQVLSEVRREQPELYPLLGNAGMLVNRLQRGSSTKLSNHAFGTAIDFYIDRYLTQRGSHRSNRGLDALAPFFNRAGWYWGATFPTDDAMHFECSASLLDSFGL